MDRRGKREMYSALLLPEWYLALGNLKNRTGISDPRVASCLLGIYMYRFMGGSTQTTT